MSQDVKEFLDFAFKDSKGTDKYKTKFELLIKLKEYEQSKLQ